LAPRGTNRLKKPTAFRSNLFRGLPYWRLSVQDAAIEQILDFENADKANPRILDLGCGLGYTLTRLSTSVRHGATLVGIDISERAIARAKILVQETGDISRVKIECANAESTPFGDEEFDIVIANLAFSVFKKPENAASEVARILKKNGRLVLTEVNKVSVLGRLGELGDALTGRLYYHLYSPSELARRFTILGLRLDRVSRIPLKLNLRGRVLKISSKISPVFLLKLSKPSRLYQGRRIK